MKIVLNKCFGGFSVSAEVYKELGIPWDGHGYISNAHFNIHGDTEAYRTHPLLIAVIEALGEAASSGALADLQIVEIPDGIEWDIEDYDGVETVHERHRSW